MQKQVKWVKWTYLLSIDKGLIIYNLAANGSVYDVSACVSVIIADSPPANCGLPTDKLLRGRMTRSCTCKFIVDTSNWFLKNILLFTYFLNPQHTLVTYSRHITHTSTMPRNPHRVDNFTKQLSVPLLWAADKTQCSSAYFLTLTWCFGKLIECVWELGNVRLCKSILDTI